MKHDFDTIKAQFSLKDEVIRVLGQPIDTCHEYDTHPCPFHAEASIGAFRVYESRYYCYSCTETGDVLDFFAWAKQKSLTEILKEHNIDDFTPEQIVQRKEEIAEIKLVAKVKADQEYEVALGNLHRVKAWLQYHDNLTPTTRQLWNERGVPEEWQNKWGLGYNPSLKYKTSLGLLTTASITIPFLDMAGEVKTVQNRLLGSIDGSRYRPEMKNLGAHPFICDIELKKEDARLLIIIEGAIKGMVTHITYNDAEVQTIGAWSKGMMIDLMKKTSGREVLAIPDPDCAEEIKEIAKQTGARVLSLPAKLDDMIVENELDAHWLRNAERQSRRM